jgi:hypothetical protein
MTERTTAEIVADLRWMEKHSDFDHEIVPEAADRLEALDAELTEFRTDAWSVRFREMAEELSSLLNLRPPCPTCNGHDFKNMGQGNPCPDCSDGRVSWERLVRVFTAVHDDRGEPLDQCCEALLQVLRSIR